MNPLKLYGIAPLLCLVLVGAAASSEEPAQDLAPVAAQASGVTPLQPGAEVPDLSLTDVQGEAHRLRTLVQDKPAVLIFYRGGWCPYCTTHLAKLKEAEPKLQELGYRIVAVSPDTPEKLAETVSDKELSFLLLSDPGLQAARAFGVAFRVDDETVAKYKEYGIALPSAAGSDDKALPVPAVFVVDGQGVIRFAYANADYRVRLDNDELLAAAREAAAE